MKENSIYDYIFLCDDETVLKFKLYISSEDVGNVIRYYLNNINPCELELVNYKKALNSTNIPLRFLPKVGKVGIKDKIFNTDSYLVPNAEDNTLELLLSDIYKCNFINSTYLNLISENLELEKPLNKNVSKKLLSLVELELVDVYDIQNGNLNVIIDDEKIFDNKSILKQIIWVLTTSKQNLKLIEKLNLKDMFLVCAKNYNVKQKVK